MMKLEAAPSLLNRDDLKKNLYVAEEKCTGNHKI